MNLEYLLLGLLALKPQTGHDFKIFLDTFGRFLRSSMELCQIYRTLALMTKRGWAQLRTPRRHGACRDRKLRDVELALGGSTVAVHRRVDLMHEWGAQQIGLWIEWLEGTIATIEKERDGSSGLRLVRGSREGG